MTHFLAPGGTLDPTSGAITAPLIVLFERDDAIAVPLISQLGMARYDVRPARTPVELFGLLGKQLVALVLVDLGNAAAGRREFWVALDAQRRGRNLQVMTFRFTTPTDLLDPEFEPAARALADVEVQGAHEFQKIIDGVRQRVPLNGNGPASLAGVAPALGGQVVGDGAIPPIGAALGIPSPLSQVAPGMPMDSQYVGQPLPAAPAFGQPAPASSPFASPVAANPFASNEAASPFAQPYTANPFSNVSSAPSSWPSSPSPALSSSDSQWAAPYGAPEPAQHAAYQSVPAFGGQQFEMPRSDPYPGGFGGANMGNMGNMGNMRQEQQPRDNAPIEDAWVPPVADAAMETGIVPSMAFQPMGEPTGTLHGDPRFSPARQSAPQPMSQPMSQPASQPRPGAYAGDAESQSTARIPAMPHHPTNGPDHALSTVLVEGALLTQQKLEALKSIQRMLEGVNMQFRLGELALLFKFLSTDQLLAALLVSRGLVSPQEIANLGRLRQELASNGTEYDLATLLQMYHILPPEQIESLRAELNQ